MISRTAKGCIMEHNRNKNTNGKDSAGGGQEAGSRKQRKPGFFYYMIPVVLLLVMVVFGVLFMRDFLAYKEADDEYSSLNENIEIVPDTAAGDNADTASEGGADVTAADYYPTLNIDFQAFADRNSDFVGVLYVPALDILYPMAKSKDNADYLHHTFEGKYNFAGCIFMDMVASDDFSDRNTFIFGHNMKNGSMFGKLKHFSTEDGLAASDPYVYVYTTKTVRKYRIFSYYQTDYNSDAYNDITDDAGYDTYVQKALKRSVFREYQNDVDFTARPLMLTLSTCSGKNSGQRFLVHSAFVSEKPLG